MSLPSDARKSVVFANDESHVTDIDDDDDDDDIDDDDDDDESPHRSGNTLHLSSLGCASCVCASSIRSHPPRPDPTINCARYCTRQEAKTTALSVSCRGTRSGHFSLYRSQRISPRG